MSEAGVRPQRILGELRAPGSSGFSGAGLWVVGRLAITSLVVAINLAGVATVLAGAYWIVPLRAVGFSGHVRVVDAVVAAACVVVALPAGTVVGTRNLFVVREWLLHDRPPGPAEARSVLLAPGRLFVLQLGLWFGAAALLGVLDSRYSTSLGVYIAVTVALSGMITAASAYLFTERVLRPAAVRVLVAGRPEGVSVPGVATRAMLAWALGSGLLLVGMAVIGVAALAGDRIDAHELAVAMVALSGLAIAVGVLSVGLSARATAAPIDEVIRALQAVENGALDTQIPVYDGTQIGQLQQGFNTMVKGLAERERIRQAFGAYVDPEIAERVLREGVALEGEEVEVTVMFLDVRGFTSFAERTPPAQVLRTLNELFDRTVPVVHAHGGRVDKFVGDGFMAVFGAPRRSDDHAGLAVRAAQEIARLVGDGALQVGIGLNSGVVVAGNVGGAGRVEFGVIGDAVNVAARVEAATRRSGDTILATERTRSLAGDASCFIERDVVALKGKRERSRLYAVAVPT